MRSRRPAHRSRRTAMSSRFEHGVRVGADAGVVRLMGVVANGATIKRAEEAVRGIAGVRRVDNKLIAGGMLDFDSAESRSFHISPGGILARALRSFSVFLMPKPSADRSTAPTTRRRPPGEAGCLLVDRDLEAQTRQKSARREPADACADDCDRPLAHGAGMRVNRTGRSDRSKTKSARCGLPVP